MWLQRCTQGESVLVSLFVDLGCHPPGSGSECKVAHHPQLDSLKHQVVMLLL